MAILVTTTGTDVVLNDLGGYTIPHPTVDFDLTERFTEDQLIYSDDFRAAVEDSPAKLTIKTGLGNVITYAEIDGIAEAAELRHLNLTIDPLFTGGLSLNQATQVLGISPATPSTPGGMSAEDKAKLDALAPDNSLVSGSVVWSGSGFTFDVTDLEYIISGTTFNTLAQQLTLTAADPLLDRIDVFYADDQGNVGFITGTPAPSPVKPQVDLATQLEISFVTVEGGSTSPGIVTEDIYIDNTEWVTSPLTSPNNFDFASTNDAYPPTSPTTGVSIETLAQLNNDDSFRLTEPSSPSGYTWVANSTLELRIFNKTDWNGGKLRLRFQLVSGVDAGTFVDLEEGKYGFTQANTVNWQTIAIPAGLFSILNGTVIGSLTVTKINDGNVEFFLDQIRMQEGISSDLAPTLGSINEHSDVDTISQTPTVGDRLAWNGSNWVPSSSSTANQSNNFLYVFSKSIDLVDIVDSFQPVPWTDIIQQDGWFEDDLYRPTEFLCVTSGQYAITYELITEQEGGNNGDIYSWAELSVPESSPTVWNQIAGSHIGLGVLTANTPLPLSRTFLFNADVGQLIRIVWGATVSDARIAPAHNAYATFQEDVFDFAALGATAGSLMAGVYFTLNSPILKTVVWYSVGGVGTPPTVDGVEFINVDVLAGDTANQVATKTADAVDAYTFENSAVFTAAKAAGQTPEVTTSTDTGGAGGFDYRGFVEAPTIFNNPSPGITIANTTTGISEQISGGLTIRRLT